MKKLRQLFQNLRLKWQIILWALGLVLVSIVISGTVLIENFTTTLENEIGAKALAVARTVAQIEEIQKNVGQPDGHQVIQPMVERIRLATNVEYIVVIDMDRVRYSHPIQDRIGELFEGGDEGPALADHQYISRALGILGPSVRAFVPIKTDEGNRQVGVVVVGILTPTVSKILSQIRFDMYLSLVAGIVIGAIGSVLLAQNIKKQMFNLEPTEIARILEERIAVIQSIGEGIVAVDRDYRITIINEEAIRMLGLSNVHKLIGTPIDQLVPDSQLPHTAKTGQAAYNQERIVAGNNLLVSRIPIRVKGEIMGAVSTIRDKTEVKRLAEELTGVKAYIEALRVQNHEHMNKLHTIAGLIQLAKYKQAIDYIFEITEEQQNMSDFISRSIKDYSIAGLLLGKYSRSKELQIHLEIDKESNIDYLPPALDQAALGIIIGNLLENALDSVRGLSKDRRYVYCLVKQQDNELKIVVKDKGPGIKGDILDKVFTKGFSTKPGNYRGYGLALVKQYVDVAGGNIAVKSIIDKGTEMVVELYY